MDGFIPDTVALMIEKYRYGFVLERRRRQRC